MHARFLDRVPKMLHDTPFRRYWIGQSLSLIGSQVSGMAVPLTAVLALIPVAHAPDAHGARVPAPGVISVTATGRPAGASSM